MEDLKYSVITLFGGEGRKVRDIKEVPIDYKRKSFDVGCSFYLCLSVRGCVLY